MEERLRSMMEFYDSGELLPAVVKTGEHIASRLLSVLGRDLRGIGLDVGAGRDGVYLRALAAALPAVAWFPSDVDASHVPFFEKHAKGSSMAGRYLRLDILGRPLVAANDTAAALRGRVAVMTCCNLAKQLVVARQFDAVGHHCPSSVIRDVLGAAAEMLSPSGVFAWFEMIWTRDAAYRKAVEGAHELAGLVGLRLRSRSQDILVFDRVRQRCAACGTLDVPLRCPCRVARYCDTKCQRQVRPTADMVAIAGAQDWHVHTSAHKGDMPKASSFGDDVRHRPSWLPLPSTTTSSSATRLELVRGLGDAASFEAFAVYCKGQNLELAERCLRAGLEKWPKDAALNRALVVFLGDVCGKFDSARRRLDELGVGRQGDYYCRVAQQAAKYGDSGPLGLNENDDEFQPRLSIPLDVEVPYMDDDSLRSCVELAWPPVVHEDTSDPDELRRRALCALAATRLLPPLSSS